MQYNTFVTDVAIQVVRHRAARGTSSVVAEAATLLTMLTTMISTSQSCRTAIWATNVVRQRLVMQIMTPSVRIVLTDNTRLPGLSHNHIVHVRPTWHEQKHAPIEAMSVDKIRS